MGRIRTTFEVVTEESAAEGGAAERGWVDEEGEVLGVEAAIKWLRDKGPLGPSSSQFHKGIWYSSEPVPTLENGEWYQEAYHLAGFTEAQQRRIYEGVVGRRNPSRVRMVREKLRAADAAAPARRAAVAAKRKKMFREGSGYTPCRCRDCMEIAVSSDMRKPQFCSACKKAGCEDGGECRAVSEDDEGLEEFQRGIYDAVELNRKNPRVTVQKRPCVSCGVPTYAADGLCRRCSPTGDEDARLSTGAERAKRRKNPPYGYSDEAPEDTERMRQLKAISDAVMARKNPREELIAHWKGPSRTWAKVYYAEAERGTGVPYRVTYDNGDGAQYEGFSDKKSAMRFAKSVLRTPGGFIN